MTSTEFKSKCPDLHAKLQARGVDFDKLQAGLVGFDWSNFLKIVEAIIAAITPLLPAA